MDREQVIRESLVDRYLLGQLDEAKAMAFEDFYAGSAETLAELEESALLIDGLREISGAERQGSLVAASGTGRRGPAGTLRRFVGSPVYGAAASLLAAIALVALFAGVSPFGTGSTNDAPAAAINMPIVTLSPMRGGSEGLEVVVSDSRYVAMELDLGVPEADSYRVSLVDDAGDLLWQGNGLRPGTMASLTFMLPADLLGDGNFRLIARPADGPGQTLTYPFFTAR